MIISNCPRCHEQYRIPTGSLPQNAYAQCPWCHETFSLQEAMQSLPPVLKLIGADGNAIAPVSVPSAHDDSATVATGYVASSASPGWFEGSAGPGLAIEDDLSSTGLDEYDDGDAFGPEHDFDEPASTRREANVDDEIDPEFVIQDSRGAATMAPMRVQPAPSFSGAARRKKKGSPLKTLVGFAMGAVIAVPAAGAILLGLDQLGYTTAPNLGIWPMDGSFSKSASVNRPNVSAPMPMPSPAVTTPSAGRSLVEELGDAAGDATDASSDALAQIQSPELTSTEEVAVETLSVEVATPSMKIPKPDVAIIEPEPSIAAETAPATAGLKPANSEPVASEPEAMAEAAPANDTSTAQSTTPSLEELDAPVATIVNSYSPELVSARDDAGKMFDQLASFGTDDAKRKPVLGATYASLAKFVSLMDSSDVSAADEMVAMIKDNESLLSDFARATPIWINLPPAKRPNQGVVIVGDLDTSGDSPTIRLSNDSQIPVESNDGKTLSSGRVLGLGKIIDGADGPSVELTRVESLSQ